MEEKKQEDIVVAEHNKDDKSLGITKSRSLNRYAILDSISEEIDLVTLDMGEQIEDDIVVEIRKAKAASSGVVELMKTLKTRKKCPINKRNKAKKSSSTSEGQCCSPSI